MGITRYLLIGTVAVIGGVGLAAIFKKKVQESPMELVEEIAIAPVTPESKVPVTALPGAALFESVVEIDRVRQLFALDSSKLPIVETVSYTSRVPWLKGRPAWIADYASHYATSRHFIARSLNRKPDYFTQKISPGDRFNVFKRDKNLQFYLVIDQSSCRMWFYYLDLDTNERVLLKTYRVGLGRIDSKTVSGTLTPVGKYQLGDKITIYKPGMMGFFQDRKMEMIRIFGTRWIPFHKELEGCSASAHGFGLHGAPWTLDPITGQVAEDRSKIGKYDSDGCIRLASEDIEELFAIIITKPTTIELVKEFHEAKLPGVEKKL